MNTVAKATHLDERLQELRQATYRNVDVSGCAFPVARCLEYVLPHDRLPSS